MYALVKVHVQLTLSMIFPDQLLQLIAARKKKKNFESKAHYYVDETPTQC